MFKFQIRFLSFRALLTNIHKMSSFANLTKIPRIQKPALPAEQAHLVKSTKVAFSDTLLSCGDYRNIYSNLTVLFIGDNSIRTLFRDMCKSLKSGHLLDYMEASRQNGKYKTADGNFHKESCR